MTKRKIVRAKLDGLECIVLKTFISEDKLGLLKASHYSELYFKGNWLPVNEWAGTSIIERKHLAVFIYTNRLDMGEAGDLMFFAKMPEIRFESRHPEWGEPDGKHYAVPLSFPVSKVVLFAEELGHDDH